MELKLSPYKLKFRKTSKTRQGYLLRLEDSAGAFGYSDISPWPEFGDPPVEDIPRFLKERKVLPPLLQRSLEFAGLDLNARVAGVSLLRNVNFQNHFFVSDLTSLEPIERALEEGFVKFKIKCGNDLQKEISFLKKINESFKSVLQVRLDFNGKLLKSEEKLFYPFLDFIEFVEDPFATAGDWIGSKFKLAYDHPGFPEEKIDFDWRIVKPAKEGTPEARNKKIVFTNYLGHSVGVAHDSYQASLFGDPITEYGLMSDNVFEPNSFNDLLVKKGPMLSFREGLGIGFDSLLKEQQWMSL